MLIAGVILSLFPLLLYRPPSTLTSLVKLKAVDAFEFVPWQNKLQKHDMSTNRRRDARRR